MLSLQKRRGLVRPTSYLLRLLWVGLTWLRCGGIRLRGSQLKWLPLADTIS